MTFNMTIKTKLLGGFGIMILVLVAIGAVNHFTVSGMIVQSEKAILDMALETELTQREVDHLIWAAKVRDFSEKTGQGKLDVETDHTRCGFGRWYYGEGRRQLEQAIPGLARLLAAIETPHRNLHASAVALEENVRETGDHSHAPAIYAAQTVPALAETQSLLRQIRNEAKEEMTSRREATNTAMRDRASRINILVVVAAFLTMAIGWFTARNIIVIIRGVAGKMADYSAQVAASADQVASGGQELAEGATRQAAALEETTASLEEIDSMTRQNADNAAAAAGLMQEAAAVVRRAGDSMAQLTASMQTISKASEETSKIVKTIDEIAFQTNLLALNAAVEAARAGEAGAGFAVVADEVRNLAMRAAEAAKNTATLIEGTVRSIGEGRQLVDHTGTTFNEVAASTAKANSLAGEIAVASDEQAQGIRQLNQAVSEMDGVVQSGAANAEESAAAAEELSAMAAEMENIVAELLLLTDGGKDRPSSPGTKDAGLPTIF